MRVDTGVYEGGEIPMYYDSMIAKLIVHGWTATTRSPDARGAQRLRDPRRVQQHPVPGGAAGASEVRCRPVQHRLHRRALYPKGFSAALVPHDEPDFLVALAARRTAARERAPRISGSLPGHEVEIGEEFVIVVLEPARGHPRPDAGAGDRRRRRHGTA